MSLELKMLIHTPHLKHLLIKSNRCIDVSKDLERTRIGPSRDHPDQIAADQYASWFKRALQLTSPSGTFCHSIFVLSHHSLPIILGVLLKELG